MLGIWTTARRTGPRRRRRMRRTCVCMRWGFYASVYLPVLFLTISMRICSLSGLNKQNLSFNKLSRKCLLFLGAVCCAVVRVPCIQSVWTKQGQKCQWDTNPRPSSGRSVEWGLEASQAVKQGWPETMRFGHVCGRGRPPSSHRLADPNLENALATGCAWITRPL